MIEKKLNLKNFTIPQLVRKAYLEEDDDIYMEYIWELRKRGNDEVLKMAKNLAYSKDPVYRDIAGSILSQIAYKSKSFNGESRHLLGKLLNDPHEDVVTSAIYGLGHRPCLRYCNKLASLVTVSTSLQMREALSFSLGHCRSEKAIDALIRLTHDENFDVRNWATFELAQINDINSQKIRDALYEKLHDSESEVRGEALLGLALRKDERVKEAIIEDLQREFYGSWILTAIVEMPDARYKQYFEKYIVTLNEEDQKAFQRDIEEATQALKEV